MKIKILSSIALLSLLFLINGCKADVDNSITFRNLSSGTIYVNFRGQLVTVPSGGTASVSQIQKGSYTYNTTYQVPAGATSSSFQGAISGTVVINAGTKILIVYSSTFLNNQYIIYATISSNDDVNGTSNP